MTLYDPWCYSPEPEPDTRILFKDLILNNSEDIKTYMTWENYDLNDTVLTVTEKVKDHALVVLMNSYGKFKVEEEDTLEPFLADVFIYFPILLQQLAITRLIDAGGVVKNDSNIVETTRTEVFDGSSNTNSEFVPTTVVSESNVVETETKTTGTVAVDNEINTTVSNTTDIANNSGVLATGTRNVSLNHTMPEQSINGVTHDFTIDLQGTPTLSTSTVQAATEGFTTSNPINTTETSNQTAENTTIGSNNSTTTNDVTVADTGTTTRTVTNSGQDNSESNTLTSNNNEVTETVTSTLTNKQYAYEIKAFLETADSLIAFKKWEDNFSWVVGVL